MKGSYYREFEVGMGGGGCVCQICDCRRQAMRV